MISNRKEVPNPSNFLRLMSLRLPNVRSAMIKEILSGYLLERCVDTIPPRERP